VIEGCSPAAPDKLLGSQKAPTVAGVSGEPLEHLALIGVQRDSQITGDSDLAAS